MLDIKLEKKLGKCFINVAFKSDVTEVIALFGPSGAGKTSVINMVAGLVRPDAGHITVNHRNLFDSNAKINLPPEKRNIGYIFQDGRLFPHLSVRSNLAYGMRNTSTSESSITFHQVVELLGIGQLLDRRPSRLSGGEKQRVAIGRALLTNPDLLLMDEPFASLDQPRKAEILPFVSRLCTEFEIPVLYVTHSLEEISRLADTLIVMDSGKIASTGQTAGPPNG
ncbi:MAG: molybdenum ABC transporter ATP-binding protein [Deltaproteobacteria bacterium]|nr:molybdenum ABC transporter ATP-binding protein [Deltaproteobacteria bacterium]